MSNQVASGKLRLAMLISGGGTTLRNLLHEIDVGRLPAEFRVVVSSNPDAGGLKFAEQAGRNALEAASDPARF